MRLSPRRFLSAHPFAAGAASALALVLGAACVAAASGHIHPFVTGTVDYEDTTSGPIIDGVQSGSGVGVEGVANTDAPAGAIAVDGLGTSTTDASIGVNGSVDGPSSTALIGNANDTSGQPSIGLEGFSENGEGVYAESESHDYPSLRAVDFEAAFDVRLADSPDGDGMSSQLESVTNGAGVLGDDTATTPSENAGVEGASANGLAGVYGTSDSGSGFGVDGVNSVTGPGVMGTSTGGGVGVMGVGPESVGVEGITDEPSASFSGAAAVSGLDESSDGGTGDIGVEGQSALGTGIEASSDDGTAIFAVSTEGVGADIRSSENTAVEARGATFGLEGTASGASGAGVAGNGSIGSIGQCNGSGTDEFEGADASGTVNFSVDCSGTVGAVIRSRDGMYADATVPKSTQSTIEDYGEAQLVDGAATVALDPAFAKSISDRQPYLVFVTPDGPSRGLYVAQKSLEGFTVRENPGGTSTIAFDYRIVAKPANDDRPRMSLSPRPLAVVRLPAVPVRPSLAPSRAIAVAAVRRLEAAQRAGIRAHRQLPQRMPLYEPRIGQDGKLHPGQTYVPKPHG